MSIPPSLTLRRRFNAPPARVYAAWTRPEQMMKWWAPAEIETVHAEADARVGGRFRVVMQEANGETHDVSGTFHEVVPEAKLVFTWTWRSTPERESLVTVLLRPDGDGTWLTLTHEQLFDEATRNSHESGWSTALDKLERALA